ACKVASIGVGSELLLFPFGLAHPSEFQAFPKRKPISDEFPSRPFIETPSLAKDHLGDVSQTISSLDPHLSPGIQPDREGIGLQLDLENLRSPIVLNDLHHVLQIMGRLQRSKSLIEEMKLSRS